MVNPAGTLRLTLNIYEARETATNRFVSTFSGAGVHHVAYHRRCPAHRRAAVRGEASILAIPANYYEDLSARLGLDDAAATGLERLGMLYDRDAGGELHQACMEAFQDRFFFEVVERCYGYARFGVTNAALRMAAQARNFVAQT